MRNWCVLNILVGVTALAQSPVKPGHVRGVVVDSATGAPIPRVHVTLHSEANGKPLLYGAMTTAEGRFSLDPIPPAVWEVMAERVGYVMQRDDFGIDLHQDETISDITVKLTPTGAILGRVTHSDGEPAENIFVSAAGSGVPVVATTDEQGRYRIGGLSPGRYRVMAGTVAVSQFPPEIPSDGSSPVHDATTWFPSRIIVGPGADSAGNDIRLTQAPVVRVSGHVTGLPEGMATVVIRAGTSFNGQVPIRRDGTFESWGLDPGHYILYAQAIAARSHLPPRSAGVEVEVAGSNVDGLELRIVPPLDIAGHLKFDEEGARLSNTSSNSHRRIAFSDDGSNVGIVRPLESGTDDSFRLPSVPPGRYWIDLLPEGVYVKSVTYGSITTDGALLDLSNGTPGAEVSLVLSSAVGSVSGKADPPGSHVELTFNDGSKRIRSTSSSPDGAWSIDNLPPGTYRIALRGEDADESIEIKPGERITKDLKQRP